MEVGIGATVHVKVGKQLKPCVIEADGVCRSLSCRAPLFWVRTENDRPMPVDRDDPSTPHWATCADPEFFRTGKSSPAPEADEPAQLSLFGGGKAA